MDIENCEWCNWCDNENDQPDYSEYCTDCEPYINDCESDECDGVYFEGEGYELIYPNGERRTLCEYCYDRKTCVECGDNYATMGELCSNCVK